MEAPWEVPVGIRLMNSYDVLFCEQLLNTHKFYAHAEDLCRLSEVIQGREGRRDPDIGVVRIFSVWVSRSGTGHHNAGLFALRNDRFRASVERVEGDKISAIRFCPLPDFQTAKFLI